MLLDGKVALITGAGGVLGSAISNAFVNQGCHVMLADISQESIYTTIQTISETKNVGSHIIDITSNDEPKNTIEAVFSRFKKIDFLITAAGVLKRNPIHKITDDELKMVFDVNFNFVFQLCRIAIPLMESQGSIVTLASLSAHTGRAFSSHYAASKGAIVALTKSIATESAPNIRANCIPPGFVKTPLSNVILKEEHDQQISSIPLRRFGEPSEIGNVAVFLCSNWSSYMTGQTLHVNGGMYSSG